MTFQRAAWMHTDGLVGGSNTNVLSLKDQIANGKSNLGYINLPEWSSNLACSWSVSLISCYPSITPELQSGKEPFSIQLWFLHVSIHVLPFCVTLVWLQGSVSLRSKVIFIRTLNFHDASVFTSFQYSSSESNLYWCIVVLNYVEKRSLLWLYSRQMSILVTLQ